MLTPHQIANRLVAVAGSSLATVMFVPAAFAMPEGPGRGSSEQAFVPGTTPHTPTHIADTTSSSFDWSGPFFVVLLIGLATLLAAVAVRYTASRRGARLLVR